MSRAAVSVEGLGKRYHIGAPTRSHRTLAEKINHAIRAPARRAWKLMHGHATGASELDEEMWALRDISFDVSEGEIVGIIGRNGAGKSTLLKVLSRITEPTEGHVELRGRVGSLLEVGTGFHPELTGRENVYLNGAILGMGRAEIERKFDEIVAFSEVEKFVDTPVKHYSTGMRLRLAFAVAAHLEPEILIVDEVLAVGDVGFQKKCLAKMEDVGRHGRTVLFVSHSMPAVTRLCQRTILLEEGRMLMDGPSHKVVGTYLNSGLGTTAAREWPDPETAPSGTVTRLRAVRVTSVDGSTMDACDIREPIVLEMTFEVHGPGPVLLPNFVLHNEEGVCAFATYDQDPAWRGRPRGPGVYQSRAVIPGNLLAEGTFFASACCAALNPFRLEFRAMEAVAFQVVDSLDGNSARGDVGFQIPGVVRPLLRWSTEFMPSRRDFAVASSAASGVS